MRHILPFLIVVLCLSCNRPLEVGDYCRYRSDKGIVLQLDADGNPTMLMSLEEACNLDADSAVAWAKSLNDDPDGAQWSLPNNEQLSLMAQNKSAINTTLSERGLPSVLTNRTWYWSSTVCADAQCPTCPVSHVYAFGPDGLRCYFRENASALYRARAVKVLGNAAQSSLPVSSDASKASSSLNGDSSKTNTVL